MVKFFKQEKILLLTMGIASFLFVFYFLAMHWHLRPGGGENTFMCWLKTKNIFQLTFHFYKNDSGRMATTAYSAILHSIGTNLEFPNRAIFGHYLVSLGLFLIGIKMLLRIFYAHFGNLRPSDLELWIQSTLIFAGFYFSAACIIENWYWTNCSFQPVIYSMLGISLFLIENKKFWMKAAMVFCFAFIGNGTEIIAVPMITIFGIFLLKTLIRVGKLNALLFNQKKIKDVLLIFMVLLFGLSLNVASPGNVERLKRIEDRRSMESLTSTTVQDGIFAYNKNMNDVLLDRKNVVWLILISLFFFIGNKNKLDEDQKKRLHQWMLYLFSFIFLMVLFSSLLFLFTLGNLGPLRAWLPVTTALTLLGVLISFYLGSQLKNKFIYAPFALFFLNTYLIVSFARHSYFHLPIVSKYSAAYDARLDLLRSLHPLQKDTIELEPLPLTQMFFHEEILKEWQAEAYVCAHDIPFMIKLKESESKNSN